MLQVFAVLALSVGAVAFTVSQTKIFAPFRVWTVTHKRSTTWGGKKFAELVSCPYCLSHWFSFGAVGIYRVRLVHEFLPLDYLVSAMAMAGLAMLSCLIIRKGLGLDVPKPAVARTGPSPIDRFPH